MATRIKDTEVDEQDAARAFAATLQRNLRYVREEEKPELAAVLRRKGWSYRRIAEALTTPYGVVSRWLSGPDLELRQFAAAGRLCAARRAVQAAAPMAPLAAPDQADDAATAAVASRIDALATRLDQIVESLESERQSARGREERLLTAIDELKAAITALRS
ncbi:MAG: hypothetical protein FJX35_21645 [Alphaproteobacteria bacterium]|nr:hypothetical protein [Alphaproteobacteria bacterium]